MRSPKTVFYPEVQAGGFTHVDGTIEFYQRINALLQPNMTVIDFGAGRGRFLEDPVKYRRELRNLKGKATKIIGLDTDSVVLKNPTLDEAYQIAEGSLLPLADASIDLIISDFTFEHVGDPAWASRELHRVLRPGGWICARTPNKHGYIGVGARLVPSSRHVAFLRWLQPYKLPEDTFPTAYRLNTQAALLNYFPSSKFMHRTYKMNNEPAYFADSLVCWQLARLAFRVTPASLKAVFYIFLQKIR